VRFDACQYLLDLKWLGDIVNTAKGESLNLVSGLIQRADENDWNITLRPGILMSRRIKSGGAARAFIKASSPLRAGRTLYPCSVNMAVSKRRLAGVSSAIRISPEDDFLGLVVDGFIILLPTITGKESAPATCQIQNRLPMPPACQPDGIPGDG